MSWDFSIAGLVPRGLADTTGTLEYKDKQIFGHSFSKTLKYVAKASKFGWDSGVPRVSCPQSACGCRGDRAGRVVVGRLRGAGLALQEPSSVSRVRLNARLNISNADLMLVSSAQRRA